MLRLNDSSYNHFVEANKYVVIIFDAKWSVDSGRIIIKKAIDAEKEANGRIVFASVDVDLSPQVVSQLHILNVPTVAYYRDGRLISKVIGASQSLVEKIAEMEK